MAGLTDQPFAYVAGKAEYLRITHHGRLAKELRGREAAKLLQRLEAADAAGQQMLMAKATGQFKMGTETSIRPGADRRD